MAVPYTFGTATAAIPLSQLDSNFATAITIGNTAVQLGNTVTTLNNMTLANVTISSGTVTITNVAVTTANVSGTANISTLVVVGNATVGGNTTITGNITAANANVTTNLVLSGGTANGVAYLNGSKVLTTGSALTYNGTDLAISGKITSTVANNASYQIAGAFTNATNADFLVQLKTNYTQIGPSTLTPLALAIGGTEKVTIGAATGGVGAVGIGYTSLTSVGDNGLAVLGNVGIGTSSPGAKLVSEVSGSTAQLKLTQTSYASYNFKVNTDSSLTIDKDGTTRLTVDTSGNLGLRVTPNASWDGTFPALQIGLGTVLYNNTSANGTFLGSNFYWNGANNIYLNNANATAYGQTAGAHQWFTAGIGTGIVNFTQAMTLDASSRLLVGLTSSLNGNGAVQAGGFSDTRVVIDGSSTQGIFFTKSGADNGTYRVDASGNYNWFVKGAGTANMTLDASGNLLVGKTSAGSLTTNGGELDADGTLIAVRNTAAGFVGYVTNNNASGSGLFEFRRQSTVVGSITYNGSLTLFNQTSDQRLKENIVDAGTALSILNQIKIRSFDWIESKTHETHGVVAQELKEIAPQCVTEGIDHEDGSIDRPWQIDTSPLVPMLIKAIQEQQALITQLTSRITALEGA